MSVLAGVGIVAIGRNEGERLHRCLASLLRDVDASRIVYVDSGSTDGSVQHAEGLGVRVVTLEMSTPFTAARARNAGLERLLQEHPGLAFVQFVDGDCEVRDGWLAAGASSLQHDTTIAAVSGRLRERFPEASLYNRLADLEWDRPAGDEKSCGGNAMFRVDAFQRAGGFDPTLIGGEEPELCARLRSRGLRIVRLPDDMALHDIAMTRRSQWNRRARRHGRAIVEVSYFRTPASRGLFASQLRSVLIWGAAWPVLCALALLLTLGAWLTLGKAAAAIAGAFTLLLVLAGILQVTRIARQARTRGLSRAQAWAYAAILMNAKRSQFRGVLDALRDAKRTRAAQSLPTA